MAGTRDKGWQEGVRPGWETGDEGREGRVEGGVKLRQEVEDCARAEDI